MSRATFHVGDALTILPTLPASSVDLVVTSPPFLRQRSYLPKGHPLKALEHGNEPNPAAFLAVMLDVTEALGRVLAPHGSIAVELGDKYAGSGGAGGDYGENGLRDGQNKFDKVPAGGRWPENKSLCGIPDAYQLSLTYGRNILALPGEPWWREFRRWRARNKVAWVRNNPPVGSLEDKWRAGGSTYITVATRSPSRWWDDIATRKPTDRYDLGGIRKGSINGTDETRAQSGETRQTSGSNPAGAPLLDWWNIPPTGYTSRLGAHYATFPDELVTPLIQAMCPRRVCTQCGAPSRRLTEASYEGTTTRRVTSAASRAVADGVSGGHYAMRETNPVRTVTELGWSSCGCPAADGIRDDGYHTGPTWRPGMVLDPYCGTGTVGLVATGHGRDATLIDLNPTNAILAEERLGMFLDVVEGAA